MKRFENKLGANALKKIINLVKGGNK